MKQKANRELTFQKASRTNTLLHRLWLFFLITCIILLIVFCGLLVAHYVFDLPWPDGLMPDKTDY